MRYEARYRSAVAPPATIRAVQAHALTRGWGLLHVFKTLLDKKLTPLIDSPICCNAAGWAAALTPTFFLPRAISAEQLVEAPTASQLRGPQRASGLAVHPSWRFLTGHVTVHLSARQGVFRYSSAPFTFFLVGSSGVRFGRILRGIGEAQPQDIAMRGSDEGRIARQQRHRGREKRNKISMRAGGSSRLASWRRTGAGDVSRRAGQVSLSIDRSEDVRRSLGDCGMVW